MMLTIFYWPRAHHITIVSWFIVIDWKIKKALDFGVNPSNHANVFKILLMTKPISWSSFMTKWDKVFKNGPSKTCGRQPLKNMKECGLLLSCLLRLSSTNFNSATLEYFVPNDVWCKRYIDKRTFLHMLIPIILPQYLME